MLHAFKFIFTLLIFCSCTLMQQKDFSLEEKKAYTEKINKFFEQAYEEKLALSPEHQTYRGLKTNYDKLDDRSDAMDEKYRELDRAHLKRLKEFNPYSLLPEARLSYELFKYRIQRNLESYQFKDHNFPVNQMFGRHSGLASFMINMHRIQNLEEANAYISRLNAFEEQFDELIFQLKKRQEMGIMAPKFVYPKAISDAQNIVSGAPFDKSNKESPLYKDFREKITQLDLTNQQGQALMARVEQALLSSVGPGYWKLIETLEDLEKEAPKEVSAKDLPNGKAFYQQRLKNMTTSELSASEIHQLGLEQTKRIHAEMKSIMREVEFEGDLNQFFNFMRESEQFKYKDSKAGKEAYLKDTRAIIKKAWARLPEMFGLLPKAELTVKAVEPFREKSAGLAFYQGPSAKGERPGIYYVNLNDMNAVSKYEQQALAYHEAVPGHHMQIAIANELTQLPRFRRFGGYTAYSEGWALYAEKLASEFDLYSDAYAEFGRLSMELMRAARLVVDTGLHDKGWPMDKAISWLNKNTPTAKAENERAIQRYIVMPAQATSYMIGMRKILELRELAKKELGKKFSLREFHDEILKDGSIPLFMLEEKIKNWIVDSKKSN